jgi:hypothetical protein
MFLPSIGQTWVLASIGAVVEMGVKRLLMEPNSKIPWYPKLLFQRENALASF